MKLVHKKNDTTICNDIKIANTFFKRFKGLMLISDLNPDSGLLIDPCNSIHTFFMRFPIDVIFLDDQYRVIHLIEAMKPWRLSKIVKKARYVIEINPHLIKDKDISIKDILQIL